MGEDPPEPELTCERHQMVIPAGGECPACLGEAQAPDLEAILRASQGITPDMGGAMRALAQVHADWRAAWRETGEFTDDETFELVRILVATSSGGLRALDLFRTSGTSRASGPRRARPLPPGRYQRAGPAGSRSPGRSGRRSRPYLIGPRAARSVRKIPGRSPEDPRKIPGRSPEDPRKIPGRSPEDPRKIPGRSPEDSCAT